MIQEILEFNQIFVENKEYQPYITSKYPEKKLAIVSCMDTRLMELLPAALGLKNGDAKIIKNAGGVISHPYGSAVRSLLIAILELGVNEIMIVGHTECGVQAVDSKKMIQKLLDRGIQKDTIDMLEYSGVEFERWLGGFDTVDTSVGKTLELLRKHPLIPKDVIIRGFVMDSTTGKLGEIM